MSTNPILRPGRYPDGELEAAELMSLRVPAGSEVQAAMDSPKRGQVARIGEQEVTVLFADLRGYTSYAEDREPREAFALVDAYARESSRILHRRGGCVMDVQGDGVMAIFGAPYPLPSKERESVAAAREIVEVVEGLDAFPALHRGEGPVVRIGIATGRVFLGHVGLPGQHAWSAAGDTTNLAARLQEMAARLRVPILIDTTTWKRAEISGATVHPALKIRGRSQRPDVYAIE